ncbi:OmpP1/FadL family transporter [Desulfurobacterium atlanticum]|uniref:Long-chain fatty acid transport protein n=1 Tax=Desulfurobacterium atlanticum TaxID=240169 RepID=A0A238Y0I5_9BACT|nr:outer membrane protein transport protein [Desulfurobacterium atlanticum]SNR64490.1 long-chain fatty acid transport protein [Desulfurobacterium atlanticum]
MKKFFCPLALVFFFSFSAHAGNVDTFGIGSAATALGGAFSATADDPYAVYYNPAGLVNIDGQVVSFGFELLNPELKVDNFKAEDGSGAKVVPYNVEVKDESPVLPVPFMGYAVKLNEKLAFGVVAYVPYGLHIKWNSDPSINPAAYNCFESYYIRGVVTPTVAFKFNKNLSFGFGVSFGRSDAGTQRRFYDPTIPSLHNKIVKSDFSDDFNVSFNFGMMYKPADKVTLGLTYRSRTATDFKGSVEIEGVASVDATTKIDHPEQIQGGIRYTPDDRLSLELDVVWTHWSAIDKYVVKFDQSLLGKTEEVFVRDWEDTRQVRFGISYKLNEMVVLRGGYFYDPSPIPDHTFDMAWPDADKKTYSAGAGFNFGRLKVDTVIQYSVSESKREIGGESEELNSSYNDGSVALSAEGHLWGIGATVSYSF